MTENSDQIVFNDSDSGFNPEEITEAEILPVEIKPAIKWGWLRAILFFIAFIITSQIFIAGFYMLYVKLFVTSSADFMTEFRNFAKDEGLLSSLIGQGSMFGGMLLMAGIFRRFIDRKSFKSLGFEWSNYRNHLVHGLLWGAGLISLGSLILYIGKGISISAIHLNWGMLFGYLVLFIIVAFNEEIMVRGYMLSNFFDSMNRYVALTVTSLMFAVMHLGNPNISAIPFINIFLAGVLLGIYYLHNRNLWFPIGIHLTWNYFQGPVWGFEVSGVNSPGVFSLERTGSTLMTGGEFGFEGSLVATILMVAAIILIHLYYQPKQNEA